MKKRGQILIENVVFIILNLLFLSIMVIFLMKQSTGIPVLEQGYSKEVALLIDASQPGMMMQLNLNKALPITKKDGYPFNKMFSFENHEVTVKLTQNSSYSYHYFNDVNITAYPQLNSKSEPTGVYVFSVK